MKQTMLWMLGLCMAILPTGRPHAAEFTETTETTETAAPAVCDTIFMTWTAEAGVEKPLSIGVEAPEAWDGAGETFWVTFGDGTEGHSYALSDTAFTKIYTEAGSYNVTITVSHPEVRITSFNCFDYNAGTDNGVTGLDVSGCTALKVLGCSNNRLTSLYVGTCTALTQLGCNDNPLSSLDVSRNTVLTTLHCANTQLTSLDVTRNTALVKLQCSYNGLTSLDVSQNTALMWLECYNTQLTSLDVSRNPALKELQCFDNSRVVDLDMDNGFDLSTLPGMDVSRIGGVTGGRLEGSRLIFEANEVSYYYETHFQGEVALAFDSVWFKLVASAPLTPVEPDEPTDPTDAVCDTLCMTWMAEAGVEKWFSFTGTEGGRFMVNWGDGTDTVVIGKGGDDYWGYYHDLQHAYAETGSYNVTITATAPEMRITKFNCINASDWSRNFCLTSLDVSGCTALKELSCFDNRLTTLDVSRNTALTYLDCSGNWLTSLDVSRNTALTRLSCDTNRLAVVLGADNGFDLSTLPGMDVSRIGSVIGGRLEGSRMIFEADRVAYRYATHCCSGESCRGLDSVWFTLTIADPQTPTEPEEPTDPTDAVCDTIYWTWTAEAGVEQNFSFAGTDGGTFIVNWGDGSDVAVTGRGWDNILDIVRHTYAEAGSYNVTIMAAAPETRLIAFDCYGTYEEKDDGVMALNVSGCTALTYLGCAYNRLTSLDVSTNMALTALFCFGNRLTSLDVRANMALTGLDCDNNQLTSLDISRNPALTDLNCYNNQLTVDLDTVNSFDLSTLPGMDVSRIGSVTGGRLEGSRLIFEADKVTYQYATHFPGEASLDFDSVEFKLVASEPLTPTEPEEPTDPTDAVCDTLFMTWMAEAGEEKQFSFSGTEGGRFIVNWGDGSDTVVEAREMYSETVVRHNYLKHGDFLVEIRAQDNKSRILHFDCSGVYYETSRNVIELNVERCSSLRSLECGDNDLTMLDVSSCDKLMRLGCFRNKLSVLDVSNNAALQLLWCDYNSLSTLDVGKNIELMQLTCAGNSLSSINVQANVNLESLIIDGNNLSSIDVRSNHKLKQLILEGNSISEVDVQSNAELNYLNVAGLGLKCLDMTNNPDMEYLYAGFNQLSEIDLSQCRKLKNVVLYFNAFRLSSMYEVYTTLPSVDELTWWTWGSQDIFDTLYVGESYDVSREIEIGGQKSFISVPEGLELKDGMLRCLCPGNYDVCMMNDSVFEWMSRYDNGVVVGSDTALVQVRYHITVIGNPTDPTVPSDTLAPEHGAGWIWMASAGEEKGIEFKGTGKGFRVDWGDGDTADVAVVATAGADGAASMASLDCAASASASASKDSEKELKHRYAEEGAYTVQLIPLSQNGRLADLEVSEERVLALAFGDASMLETLDCSDNLLTELALPAAAKLKDLDCSENLLAALDLSGCAALQEADFSDNRLTSVALPTHASLKDVEGEDNRLRLSSLYGLLSGRVKNASYGFDPQSDSVTVTENAVLDLASEMTLGGRATTYTLIDAATRRPAPAGDYAADGGLFRFSKPGARYVLTLKNANVTDYEKGRADDMVAFTYYIYVSGVANEDLASDEAASAPWAYVQGRTIYLTSDAHGGAELGEVEAFTAVGQRVYRGYDRAFTVPTAGIYVLRAADGRRCKVMVR